MLIVTNPGSNLSEAELAAYGVRLTPQQIVVDGVSHDTRAGVTHEQIDAWVRGAKVHPHVVGTTAAEFVTIFRELLRADPEVFAVMTSRKIIGSHDAAVAAARTLVESHKTPRVHVLDSGVTDLGAGLACALVGEAIVAGLTPAAIEELIAAYRAHARFVFVPETLDYLVKGGRATVVRAFLANVLGVRPLIGFVDGELKVLRKVDKKGDLAAELCAALEETIPAGRPMWAAVMHGGGLVKASLAATAVRARWSVEWQVVRPLSPSIYLHAGPGTVGVAAIDLTALPWRPPKPRVA